VPREPKLRAIELQIRSGIRDAVNKATRKPFYWGGIVGYEQLEAIAQVLWTVPDSVDTEYLRGLLKWVDRALNNSRSLYENLKAAHHWLRKVAECLRYPIRSPVCKDKPGVNLDALSSQQIQHEIEALIKQLHLNSQYHPVQAELAQKLQRLWSKYGSELLHCYDIPGLPPDNLQMEALFGRLRRQTRRISGRKSTVELQVFGHYQVLFSAKSESELLEHLRQVPVSEYRAHRQNLAESEEPRRHKQRLHRNPAQTIQQLIQKIAEQVTKSRTIPSSLPSVKETKLEQPSCRKLGSSRKQSPIRGKPKQFNPQPIRINPLMMNPFYYKRYFLKR